VNDAWKTVAVMANTVREFFPALIPGAVVFLQDYLWASDSFIHLGMFQLRHCFEYACRVRHSCSVVFRKKGDIPTDTLADLVSRRRTGDFSEREIREAFAWSRSLVTDPEAKLVVDAGMAWMLNSIGRVDAARDVFAEIRKSAHASHPFYKFQEDTLRGWGFGGIID